MSDSRMRKSMRTSLRRRGKKLQEILPGDFESWDRAKCLEMIANGDEKAYFAEYKLGVEALLANEVEEAKTRFLSVSEKQPDFIPERIHLALAEIFSKQKQWKEALQHFKAQYKFSSDKYATRMGIGKCFKKLGDEESAVKSYENAIANNPDKDYLCFYKLGQLMMKQNKTKEAIDNFVKALSLNTTSFKILLRLG